MALSICRWIMHSYEPYFLFQTACVSHYERKDLAEFLEGLWASLRREVSWEIFTT